MCSASGSLTRLFCNVVENANGSLSNNPIFDYFLQEKFISQKISERKYLYEDQAFFCLLVENSYSPKTSLFFDLPALLEN